VKRLEGRIAVVTGGGNGIGRACATRFADEGADVLVADILDEPGAETVGLVKERGREALFVHLDASSEESNVAMANAAVERFGRIDVLVTAAGIVHANYKSGDIAREKKMLEDAIATMGQPGGQLLNLDVAEWQKILDVNLTGTVLAVKAVAPTMIGQKSGSIVTIASIAAKHPEAGPYAYGVSKAGVWMFTKTAARDLGSAGVRINAIGPGFIDTNMTKGLLDVDVVKQMVLMGVPMGRVGQPEEIASTAAFLASDEASFFTGEILHPDGGFYTE